MGLEEDYLGEIIDDHLLSFMISYLRDPAISSKYLDKDFNCKYRGKRGTVIRDILGRLGWVKFNQLILESEDYMSMRDIDIKFTRKHKFWERLMSDQLPVGTNSIGCWIRIIDLPRLFKLEYLSVHLEACPLRHWRREMGYSRAYIARKLSVTANDILALEIGKLYLPYINLLVVYPGWVAKRFLAWRLINPKHTFLEPEYIDNRLKRRVRKLTHPH